MDNWLHRNLAFCFLVCLLLGTIVGGMLVNKMGEREKSRSVLTGTIVINDTGYTLTKIPFSTKP